MAIIIPVTEMHKEKIVHMDLKPANIMYVNNKIKVSDLGMSKLNLATQTISNNVT